MENHPEKSPLLDRIIHKAECAMSKAEISPALEQEHQIEMEDRE